MRFYRLDGLVTFTPMGRVACGSLLMFNTDQLSVDEKMVTGQIAAKRRGERREEVNEPS